MYTYEKWDKKTDIKGYPPSHFLDGTPILKNGEVIIIKFSDVVVGLESVNQLRVTLGLSKNATIDEIGKVYIDNANAGALQIPGALQKLIDLENENKALIESQKAVLRGDYQEVAYTLYPKDFEDRVVAN